MKHPFAICALLFGVMNPLMAEPAAWPTAPQKDSTKKVTVPVSIIKSADESTSASSTAKSRKASAKLKQGTAKSATANKPAPSNGQNAQAKQPQTVVDFMQPPTWADPEFNNKKASTLPDFMQSPEWSLKPDASKKAERDGMTSYGSPVVGDDRSASANWLLPSAPISPATNYNPVPEPARRFDLGWSASKFGDGLPAWRQNTPSLDTPFMRMQRNQNEYQNARDNLEKLYQRWAPPKK